MTKSVTKIQDKDTGKKLSVVRSTEDPTKYGIVLLNPDGTTIGKSSEGVAWGTITGTLSNQTDLQAELDLKANANADNTGEEPTGKPGDIFIDLNNNSVEVKTDTERQKLAKDSDVVHKSGTETITGAKTFSGNIGDVEIPTGNSTPQVHITDESSSTDTHYYAGSIQNTVGGVTYNYSMPTKSSTLATLADIQQSGGGDVFGPNSSTNNNIVAFDGATGKVIKDSSVSVNDIALQDDIPGVIDDLTSVSETDALSANQGRVLMTEIEILQARGRYLSDWNAQTGLAKTLPKTGTTYIYNAGDYFNVYNVGPEGTTHYRPDGDTYPVPVIPSTEVETEEVADGDTYVYDGLKWILHINHGGSVSFGNLQGQPSDNTNLNNVLNAKQNKLTAGTNISISGNTISATDTKYTASTGININASNQISNSGVLSVNGNTGAVSLNTVNGTSLVGSGDIQVQETLVSGTNIKSINGTSLLGTGDISISGLPTQSGNAGKFLQTNGTNASWNNVNEFKTQAEYDALPATKTSDNKTYFIYEVEA